MKSTRKGLGKGMGVGYKNLVPMDSHIHSLSAKGQKTYLYSKPKTMKAMGYMHQFKIDKEYSIIAYSEDTRNGFRHMAKLMRNGSEVDSAKVSYLNRTWESYNFQTVMHKLLEKHFDEKKAQQMITKLEERRNLYAKGDKGKFDYMKAVVKFEDLNPDYPSSQMNGVYLETLNEYQHEPYIDEKIDNTKRFYNTLLDNFGHRIKDKEIQKEFQEKLKSGKLDAKTSPKKAIETTIEAYDKKISNLVDKKWAEKNAVEKTAPYLALKKEYDAIDKDLEVISKQQRKIEQKYSDKFLDKGSTYPKYRRQRGWNIKDSVLEKLKKELDLRFVDDYTVESLVRDMINVKRDADPTYQKLDKKYDVINTKLGKVDDKMEKLREDAGKKYDAKIDNLKEMRNKWHNMLESLPAQSQNRNTWEQRQKARNKMMRRKDMTLKKVQDKAFIKDFASKIKAKGVM